MAVPAIHLSEYLKEINMSSATLAYKLKVPTNRIADDSKRTAGRHRRYGTTAGKTIESLPTLQNEHAHV